MNKIVSQIAGSGLRECPNGGGSCVTRRRLAIVSTYDELCGIAGYTRAIEQQLAPLFDVTVFDLDQYLTRSRHKACQKLADRHIREIAAGIAAFDFVNIQLEYGTLGLTPQQIIRRLRVLATAAKGLSVTFHTILSTEEFDWGSFWGDAFTLRWTSAFNRLTCYRRSNFLAKRSYNILRVFERHKPVRIITHTKRDMRLLRDVFRLKHVFHHPLSFVTPEERDAIWARARRESFPILRNLPKSAKLIGTFGFLSEYKGFDTVVRALRHLPDDHHLLIFGGVHPQTIKKGVAIDKYIQTLLDEAYVDRTVIDEVREGTTAANVTIALDSSAGQILSGHPKSLASRIHFMGVLGDDRFRDAMAVCDVVVLSYLEVGQTSSGPIAIAIDLGCRVIASRTHAFLQYARYHPGQVEFFDIGNHLELAERLRADSPVDCRQRVVAYNTSTNAALYWQANQDYYNAEDRKVAHAAATALDGVDRSVS